MSHFKIWNIRKPPVKVFDVSVSRLSIDTGIGNAHGFSVGRKFALHHILPGCAFTDESLIGGAATDREHIYLTRRPIVSPEAVAVPLIADLFVVGLIKIAHVIGEVNVSDQIEFVQPVCREPSAENYLQQKDTDEQQQNIDENDLECFPREHALQQESAAANLYTCRARTFNREGSHREGSDWSPVVR